MPTPHGPTSTTSLLIMAALTTGCPPTEPHTGGSEQGTEASTGDGDTDGPPDLPVVCGESRRIARRSAHVECGAEQRLAANGPLSQYCVYEKPEGFQGENWAPPSAHGDCRVHVQGNGEFRASFETAVEVPSRSTPTSDWDKGVGNVEIAVVDTAGSETIDLVASGTHGPMMAAIVRDLAGGCVPLFGEGVCTRTVRTYVGLPLSGDPGSPLFDWVRGGRYGRASTVAVGIDNALNDWGTRGYEGHLIINLSLGWKDQWNSAGAARQLDPAYEMVERAACMGALIIAASGNRSPHQCDPTSIAPAAWEAFPRPTADQCKSWYPDLGVVARPGSGPLVHAVSAVDNSRRPLLNSMTATRIAAHGYRAVASHGTTTFGPMTGTSVSTAVISGIAAAKWSQQDGLDAGQLMHAIWTDGTFNGHTADFCGSSTEQRVVSFCTALTPTAACHRPLPMPSTLGKSRCSAKPDSPTEIDPMATPQPSNNVCPSCYLDLTVATKPKAGLALSDDFVDASQEKIIITLWDDNGASAKTSYEVATPGTTCTSPCLPPITATMTPYSLPVLQFPSTGASPTRAWIEIYFTNPLTGETFSAGDPLL